MKVDLRNGFQHVREHVGHDLECIFYGENKENALNVTIECKTCGCVILDFNRIEGNADSIQDIKNIIDNSAMRMEDFHELILDCSGSIGCGIVNSSSQEQAEFLFENLGFEQSIISLNGMVIRKNTDGH